MSLEEGKPSIEESISTNVVDGLNPEQKIKLLATFGEVMQTPTQDEMNVFFSTWTQSGRLDTQVIDEVMHDKDISKKGYWESVNYLLHTHGINLTPFESIVLFRLETIYNPITQESFAKINRRITRNTMWRSKDAKHASAILCSEFGKITVGDMMILDHNFSKRVLPHLVFEGIEKNRQFVEKELAASLINKSLEGLAQKNPDRFLPNLETDREFESGIGRLQERVALKLRLSGKSEFDPKVYDHEIDRFITAMKILVEMVEQKLGLMQPYLGTKTEIFLLLARLAATKDTIRHFGAAYSRQDESIADYLNTLFKTGVFEIIKYDDLYKLSVSSGFKTHLASK